MHGSLWPLVLLVGCASQSPATGASTEELCSAAPIKHADGTATMIGCSYEMHTYNITHHGTALASPQLVQSSATFTHSCGRWLYGKDSHGISIIVDRDSGEVQSHGAVHGGQAISALTHLVPPVVVKE